MSWIRPTVVLCLLVGTYPAHAAPPAGAGSVDVRVINPSVPVAVQGAVDVRSLPDVELAPGQTIESSPPLVPGVPISLSLQCTSEEVNGVRCEIEDAGEMVVTHISVNPNLTPGADGTLCFANVGVGPNLLTHSWLASQPEPTHIVLPFGVAASDAHRPFAFVSKRWDVSETCHVFLSFHGYRPLSAAPLGGAALDGE